MAEEQRDPVQWIEWGTFDVCGKRHGKAEKGKVGVGKDIRVIGVEVTEWKERKGAYVIFRRSAAQFDANVCALGGYTRGFRAAQ